MPIYEYTCTTCDHRADILHRINDPAPHFCPSCGKAGTMRKLFAPPTIHYKGSGWAKKDRGAGARSGAKGGGAAPPGESSEGKPDTTGNTDKPAGAPAASEGEAASRTSGGESTPAKGE